MTQIITCLTAEYIIQAADMRLAYRNGRRDEKEIKMIGYHYGSTVTFTGLAKQGSTTTAKWLLSVLESSPRFEVALSRIQAMAPQYVRKFQCRPDERRLAFVAATYVPDQEGPLNIPVLFLVSNFHDKNCQPMAAAVSTFGRLHHVFDIRRPIEFHWAGQDLSEKSQRTLLRRLNESIRRASGRPNANTLAKLLVQGIRLTAEREGSVGRDVLVTIIPNQSIPALARSGTELLYFGQNRRDPESLTPHLVLPRVAISDIRTFNHCTMPIPGT